MTENTEAFLWVNITIFFFNIVGLLMVKYAISKCYKSLRITRKLLGKAISCSKLINRIYGKIT